MNGLKVLLLAAGLSIAMAFWVLRSGPPQELSETQLAELYQSPLSPPSKSMRVFHLGHSLVGRDMPFMLQQLAGDDHDYSSQLGWGTSLKDHWEPGIEIAGFDIENDHPNYRDATEALTSGEYLVFVASEMVEIRDAIKYHQAADYLARWVDLARRAHPDMPIYLYENWPRVDDPEGWLHRLDKDLQRYWEQQILFPAISRSESREPIYVIPAGQVLATFVRAIEAGEGGPDVTRKEDLFRRDEDGQQDPIHLNDLGHYLVALTHFAVLYHASPVGLPHQLRRADGRPAIAPTPETAQLMQEVVWQVVGRTPKTGVAQH